MQASAIGLLGGSTVTYAAGVPNVASATATFASPPPQVATNCGDCRNRSRPGGASLNIISPKVTVVCIETTSLTCLSLLWHAVCNSSAHAKTLPALCVDFPHR